MALRPSYRLPGSAGDDIGPTSGVGALVFMAFVAAGSAYIIAAKLGSVNRIYVTAVPVAIMIGYAFLIWSARSLRLRDDQAGDNLYYMGFLFTLTSLGVSLYQFNADRAAEEIVQNFGIAIGSTITGIALRVIFNQMRRDPIEVERMMRLELADAARRVRRELDSTVVEFGYIRRGAQQAAADSFEHVASKVDEVAERLLARVADVALRSARPLEDASRRSADTISDASNLMVEALASAGRQLASDMEKLSQSAIAISRTIDAVGEKFERLRTPDEVIEVRMDPAIASLTGAVDPFSAQSDRHAQTLEGAVAAAKGVAEGSSDTLALLREHVGANALAGHAALETVNVSSSAIHDALEQFRADTWQQIDALRRVLEHTEATLRTFTEVVVRSGTDAEAQTQGVHDVLVTIERSVQALTAAAERLSDTAEDIGARRKAPIREAIR
jgi:DNA-binding ferritin-like protein